MTGQVEEGEQDKVATDISKIGKIYRSRRRSRRDRGREEEENSSKMNGNEKDDLLYNFFDEVE